jgi:predicted nucleic acid-binding protein
MGAKGGRGSSRYLHDRVADAAADRGRNGGWRTIERALEFAEALRSQPNCIVLSPGDRHWQMFTRICREADARGDLVPDAYLAALAIESGSQLVSTDRDFARFGDLDWRPPTV